MKASSLGICVRTSLLLLYGCSHAPAASSNDVVFVTALAARYALDHDVPATLREASPICLTVDGQPPAQEVLARLSVGPVQVSPGPSGCALPRAVLVEVSEVAVSGETATARAGVRLGPSGVLDFRRVDGEWRVVRPAREAGGGRGPSLPAGL